jgi:hypothetical protein
MVPLEAGCRQTTARRAFVAGGNEAERPSPEGRPLEAPEGVDRPQVGAHARVPPTWGNAHTFILYSKL